jgi:CHAT domain-containing protein
MYKTCNILITSLLILSCWVNAQEGQVKLLKYYEKANILFHSEEATDKTDVQAIALFQKFIDAKKISSVNLHETELFTAYLRKGNLLEGLLRLDEASQSYLNALNVLNKPGQNSNSLRFKTLVFLGSVYYKKNYFDSAVYFLDHAELISGTQSDETENVRLYNTLGALYYSNGNYKQSLNYLNKALSLCNKPDDEENRTAIQNNIANAYMKLEEFDKAIGYFQKIGKQVGLQHLIRYNLGRCLRADNKPELSLRYLRTVNPKEIPGVWIEMGEVFLGLGIPDSVEYMLNEFSKQVEKKKPVPNRLDRAACLILSAKLQRYRKNYFEAIHLVHQSIQILSLNFASSDPLENPVTYAGSFAQYALYEALLLKTQILREYGKETMNVKWTEASFRTLFVTIELLEYIGRSYHTDDARIFLMKKSRAVYEETLETAIYLYKVKKESHYLKEAFRICERNKASVLNIGMKQAPIPVNPAETSDEIAQYQDLRYNIARLSILMTSFRNENEISDLAKEKAGYEITLANLQKKLEKDQAYFSKRYAIDFPTFESIQQKLTNDQLLISYYISNNTLHRFLITSDSFQYASSSEFSKTEIQIKDWIDYLRNSEGKQIKTYWEGGFQISRVILPQNESIFYRKKDWIVIPDGILTQLPMESLPIDSHRGFLLEKAALSYRFSARFIMTSQTSELIPNEYPVLGFAPFSGQSIKTDSFSGSPAYTFSRLAASRSEIINLPGVHFLDTMATKSRFIKEFQHFEVIQLATHAVGDTTNMLNSFLVFYPKNPIPDQYKLFMEEIYSLPMHHTRLVVMSACETGLGKVLDHEAAISLARAFTYAGCQSTVNSLWKADDQATASILEYFHKYLQKGYSRSRALQMSKLKYIKEKDVSPVPGIWSNIILMGESEPLCKKENNQGYLLLALSGTCLLLTLAWIRIKKKKPTQL